MATPPVGSVFFSQTPDLQHAPTAATPPLAAKPQWSPSQAAVAAAYNRVGGLIGRLAARIHVPPAAVLAVFFVESSGVALKPGQAVIRLEVHHLWSNWGGSVQPGCLRCPFPLRRPQRRRRQVHPKPCVQRSCRRAVHTRPQQSGHRIRRLQSGCATGRQRGSGALRQHRRLPDHGFEFFHAGIRHRTGDVRCLPGERKRAYPWIF